MEKSTEGNKSSSGQQSEQVSSPGISAANRFSAAKSEPPTRQKTSGLEAKALGRDTINTGLEGSQSASEVSNQKANKVLSLLKELREQGINVAERASAANTNHVPPNASTSATSSTKARAVTNTNQNTVAAAKTLSIMNSTREKAKKASVLSTAHASHVSAGPAQTSFNQRDFVEPFAPIMSSHHQLYPNSGLHNMGAPQGMPVWGYPQGPNPVAMQNVNFIQVNNVPMMRSSGLPQAGGQTPPAPSASRTISTTNAYGSPPNHHVMNQLPPPDAPVYVAVPKEQLDQLYMMRGNQAMNMEGLAPHPIFSYPYGMQPRMMPIFINPSGQQVIPPYMPYMMTAPTPHQTFANDNPASNGNSTDIALGNGLADSKKRKANNAGSPVEVSNRPNKLGLWSAQVSNAAYPSPVKSSISSSPTEKLAHFMKICQLKRLPATVATAKAAVEMLSILVSIEEIQPLVLNDIVSWQYVICLLVVFAGGQPPGIIGKQKTSTSQRTMANCLFMFVLLLEKQLLQGPTSVFAASNLKKDDLKRLIAELDGLKHLFRNPLKTKSSAMGFIEEFKATYSVLWLSLDQIFGKGSEIVTKVQGFSQEAFKLLRRYFIDIVFSKEPLERPVAIPDDLLLSRSGIGSSIAVAPKNPVYHVEKVDGMTIRVIARFRDGDLPKPITGEEPPAVILISEDEHQLPAPSADMTSYAHARTSGTKVSVPIPQRILPPPVAKYVNISSQTISGTNALGTLGKPKAPISVRGWNKENVRVQDETRKVLFDIVKKIEDEHDEEVKSVLSEWSDITLASVSVPLDELAAKDDFVEMKSSLQALDSKFDDFLNDLTKLGAAVRKTNNYVQPIGKGV